MKKSASVLQERKEKKNEEKKRKKRKKNVPVLEKFPYTRAHSKLNQL